MYDKRRSHYLTRLIMQAFGNLDEELLTLQILEEMNLLAVAFRKSVTTCREGAKQPFFFPTPLKRDQENA